MEKNPSAMSLGEFLRSEREKRGVTVEQMVSATKIGLRILHSLENDRFAELPAKPFIRGFVVSYCRFLGISSQEVLTRYSRYLDEKAEDRPNRDAGHSGYAFDKKEGDGGRTGLWILMGSMIAAGGLVILIFKPSLKHHRKSHVEKLQEQVGATTAAVSPSPGPTAGLQLVGQTVSATPAPVSSPASPAASPSPSASQVHFVAPTTPLVLALTPAPVPSKPPAPAPSASPSVVAQVSPSPSDIPESMPTPEPSRRPDPLLSGKDLLKNEIRVKVVVKALGDVWVKFKVDDKAKNRLILREGITLVLYAKSMAAFQVSDPTSVSVTRSAGEPQKLLALAGGLVSDLLQKKQGWAGDGLTLITSANLSEQHPNPFQGEPVLGAPPPRPERPASESSADTP